MPTVHTLLWATETHASVFDVYDGRTRALQTARNRWTVQAHTTPATEGHAA